MENLNELATALVKAQAAIQPALKDKTNPAFRSRYADLTAIWDACREALTANGIAVIQLPHDAPEPGRVALTTMLLHVSGQSISTTVSAPLVKQDAQGVGSALTYLRRYSLAAMVGVVTDDDDDGNAASRKPAAPASYAPQATNGDTDPIVIAREKTFAHASKTAGRKLDTWPALMTWLSRPVTTPHPTSVDGWRELYKLIGERAADLATATAEVPA